VRLPITIDTIEINSLVAARPERIVAVLERETLNGLWQLTLSDPDRKREWRLGYYIDGYESRQLELQDELAQERWPNVSWPEAAWSGNKMAIYVHPGDRTVYVRMRPSDAAAPWWLKYPLLCRDAGHPLHAPVYFGTAAEGRWFFLDCLGGRREYLAGLEELEDRIRHSVCSHGCGVIHWREWHVVARGSVVISTFREPAPDDVINALRLVRW